MQQREPSVVGKTRTAARMAFAAAAIVVLAACGLKGALIEASPSASASAAAAAASAAAASAAPR